MFGRLKLFFGEVRREFKRINWPSRNEALRMSAIVVAISLLVAVFLGMLDFILVTILERVL
jgi:preprotein translocase subunit SecE